MSYYHDKFKEIKASRFSNQQQIDLAINIKKSINQHFNTEVNLEELARLNLTSKYHLIRIFKLYYGITPHQYLINKRIEAAKELLKMGKTATEACYEVGFMSIHSFSNLFKTKTGSSPSQYKRAIFDKSISKI